MKINAAKEEVKKFLSDYLQETGRPLNKPFTCVNPDHDDEHPSMSYDKKHNLIHCFSCQKSYDLLGLIQIDRNCSFMDALRYACEKYGVKLDESDTGSDGQSFQETGEHGSDHDQRPRKDLTEFFSECASGLQFASGYLAERGISQDLAKRYGLGITKQKEPTSDENGDTHFTDWTCLVIPTSKYTYTVRNLDPSTSHSNRYRHEPQGIPVPLFNLKQARQETERPVFIVEGEMDALSILEAGGQVIGLSSTNNAKKLLETLKDWKPATPLAIALDNDDAGQKAAADLIEKLEEQKVAAFICNPYGKHKDANEALVANPDALQSEVRKINENARQLAADQLRSDAIRAGRLEVTSMTEYISDFMKADQKNFTAYNNVELPFSQMNNALGGNIYPALYSLVGGTSAGKTTFFLQIADSMAARQTPVLYFSLEQSRSELLSESMSRIASSGGHFARALQIRQTDIDSDANTIITRGTTIADLKAALDTYRETIAPNMYIIEGNFNITVDAIRNAIHSFKEENPDARPVVFIDYLQILKQPDFTDTRAGADINITNLKTITRDENVPVFLISSTARGHYTESGSLDSFKESGTIEYSCDVCMSLYLSVIDDLSDSDKKSVKQKKIEEAENESPRSITLKIMKNRFGRKNKKIYFEYIPAYYSFREIDR